jgi:hypothetical protein
VGNFSSTAQYTFDFTAPLFTTLSVDPVIFTNPILLFTATDGVAIDHYEVELNGGGYTTQTSPMALTVNPLVANTVSVKAFDTAGNVTTQSIQFYPAVIITAPTTISNTTITDTTIRVVGANDILTVTAPGYTVNCPDLGSVDSDIECTITGGISATGTLTIQAEDASGPGPVSTQDYIIDTTDPTLFVSSPTLAAQATITNSFFVIEDDYGISAVTFSGAANTFSCTPTLPTSATQVVCTGDVTASGTLTIDATDTAGNTDSESRDYIIDAIPPTIMLSPAPGLYNSSQ